MWNIQHEWYLFDYFIGHYIDYFLLWSIFTAERAKKAEYII